MRHLNRTPCLLTTVFSIFFIIYLIYAAWTTTSFNSLFSETPLRFSYAQNIPVINSLTEDNFHGNSVVVSYDQIQEDFDKYR